LKLKLENEIGKINSSIEGENDNRIKDIQNMVNEMNEEFGKVYDLVFY
jgi:hypothetical protein